MLRETINLAEEYGWTEEQKKVFDSSLLYAKEQGLGWEFIMSFKESYPRRSFDSSVWEALYDWDL